MTIQELITDLKAAGANENTLRLAMNCYELGQVEQAKASAKTHGLTMKLAVGSAERAEREACAVLCENADRHRGQYFATKIRERGQHARN